MRTRQTCDTSICGQIQSIIRTRLDKLRHKPFKDDFLWWRSQFPECESAIDSISNEQSRPIIQREQRINFANFVWLYASRCNVGHMQRLSPRKIKDHNAARFWIVQKETLPIERCRSAEVTLNAVQFRQNQSDISRLDCKTSHECLNASLERFTHDGERSFRCASIDIIADSDGSWIMHRSFTFTRTNCVLSICNLSATLQILPRNSVIELIRSENPSPITCDSHRIMKETWERSTSTP